MPQGPGTYGSKRGRPPKKASAFTMKSPLMSHRYPKSVSGTVRQPMDPSSATQPPPTHPMATRPINPSAFSGYGRKSMDPGKRAVERGRVPSSAFTMKYKNSAFPFKSPLRQNANTRTWDPEIDKGREGVYLEMRPSHQWLGGARQVMKGKRGSGGTGSYNPEGLPLNKYGGTDLSI